MKVYVASSWRNRLQPAIVEILRGDGHEVYDFRNPPGKSGFGWEQLDLGDPKCWDAGVFTRALETERAKEGFHEDMEALRDCEACILVLPCGRSAHLELGWAVGAGKLTAILLDDQPEPELMYRMVGLLADHTDQIRAYLQARSMDLAGVLDAKLRERTRELEELRGVYSVVERVNEKLQRENADLRDANRALVEAYELVPAPCSAEKVR